MNTISDSIRILAGTASYDKVHLIVAEVDSVDIPSRTCIVTTISQAKTTAIENVSLMSAIDDGILFVPTVGSTVVVLRSDYVLPIIIQYSELDQILFISGSSQLSIVDGKIMLSIDSNSSTNQISIADGKIQFNSGENAGLVEVIPLVQRLNFIENKLNNFITLFNNHTHVLSTGTAATPEPIETPLESTTQRSDIEDTSVVH